MTAAQAGEFGPVPGPALATPLENDFRAFFDRLTEAGSAVSPGTAELETNDAKGTLPVPAGASTARGCWSNPIAPSTAAR